MPNLWADFFYVFRKFHRWLSFLSWKQFKHYISNTDRFCCWKCLRKNRQQNIFFEVHRQKLTWNVIFPSGYINFSHINFVSLDLQKSVFVLLYRITSIPRRLHVLQWCIRENIKRCFSFGIEANIESRTYEVLIVRELCKRIFVTHNITKMKFDFVSQLKLFNFPENKPQMV